MSHMLYPEYDSIAAHALEAYDAEYRAWVLREVAPDETWMHRLQPLHASAGTSNVCEEQTVYRVVPKNAETIRKHFAMRAALDSVKS